MFQKICEDTELINNTDFCKHVLSKIIAPLREYTDAERNMV